MFEVNGEIWQVYLNKPVHYVEIWLQLQIVHISKIEFLNEGRKSVKGFVLCLVKDKEETCEEVHSLAVPNVSSMISKRVEDVQQRLVIDLKELILKPPQLSFIYLLLLSVYCVSQNPGERPIHVHLDHIKVLLNEFIVLLHLLLQLFIVSCLITRTLRKKDIPDSKSLLIFDLVLSDKALLVYFIPYLIMSVFVEEDKFDDVRF